MTIMMTVTKPHFQFQILFDVGYIAQLCPLPTFSTVKGLTSNDHR